MKKEMYFRLDNGDQPVICDLNAIKDMIESEASEYNEKLNKELCPEWNITLVFLTDKQYDNLPEAY